MSEGFAIDRSSPHWREQWRGLGFPADEQRAFGEAYEAWDEAAHAALDGPDRSLASIPADPHWRPMLDAISNYANGAPMAMFSVLASSRPTAATVSEKAATGGREGGSVCSGRG